MRLKNQISQASLESIICILAFSIMHLLIDIGIIIISINSGMNFTEFWNWVLDNFVNGELELKLIILYLIIAPFFWGVLSIRNVRERTIDITKANCYTYTIKDMIFNNQGVCIRYKNSHLAAKRIAYYNIKKLKLTIQGTYSCLYGAYIAITDIENKEYSIFYSPVNIKKLYKLACYSQYMKNFEYNCTGDGREIKENLTKNIDKIIKNNYKIPSFINFADYFKKTLAGIFAFVFIFYIYYITPNFTTNTEKEYASHIENGYAYFQNHLYDNALAEYDKALNMNDKDHVLYYYRALVYKEERQYDRVIQEAKTGIQYVNKSSTYFKVKNYKFMKDDIGLYDILADSYMQLKEYENAITALNYLEHHSKYKYTDVYFKKGMCEFYTNQKNKALEDFEKHRDIIFDYIADQAGSEYKDDYPVYTQKDITNINAWIRAAKN